MNIRGFVVTTNCRTADEFVEHFYTRCDDTSMFVGIVEPRLLHSECAFAILLANKSPIFAGICTVLEVYPDANNAYQQRGMRIAIRRLGITSESLFAEMAALRSANKGRRFARGSTAPPENVPIPELAEDLSDDAIPIEIADELSAPAARR